MSPARTVRSSSKRSRFSRRMRIEKGIFDVFATPALSSASRRYIWKLWSLTLSVDAAPKLFLINFHRNAAKLCHTRSINSATYFIGFCVGCHSRAAAPGYGPIRRIRILQDHSKRRAVPLIFNPSMSPRPGTGIEIRGVTPDSYKEILTDEAMRLLTDLHRTFDGRR